MINTLVPLPVVSPNLPIPTQAYQSSYQTAFNNILRLFNDRVATTINANTVELASIIGGTVTFNAAVTATVTFLKAMPSTIYYIGLGGNAAGYCWYTNKSLTGFTINCSVANSNSTDWIVV